LTILLVEGGRLKEGYGMSLLIRSVQVDVSAIKAKTDNLLAAPADVDGVYVDEVTGVAGTAWPIGSKGTPVDNMTDALAIAVARKLRRIYCFGWMTIPSDVTGYEFIGQYNTGNRDGIDFNGKTVLRCYFRGFWLEGGTTTACAANMFDRSRFEDMTLGGSIFKDCYFEGTLNAQGHQFWNCHFDGATIDSTGVATGISVIKGVGTLTVTNMDSGGWWSIYGAGMELEIADSCTAGTINIYSHVKVTDNSSGTTVNDYSVETDLDKKYSILDFWSDPLEEVQLDGAVAATIALGTVTVADLPAGATIVRAIAMFKFRALENTNAGVNKLDGATVVNTSQVIQVADDTPGTYYDAINFVDDQFGMAATTREGGDVLIGSIDIAGSGKVDANDGYLFRWLLALADEDFLQFNDVQVGLRIGYSV